MQKNNLFFKSALCLALLSTFLFSKEFNQKATTNNPTLLSKWCYTSGETLLDTYKTNYIAKLSDGLHRQYASLRFLAQDWDAIKDRLKQILVVDAKTEQFIDAYTAHFVINSKAKTSYSKYSKIAFANEQDAKQFIAEYGGDIRDFDFTLYVATKDVELDITTFEKKQNRTYKQGEKIFQKVCNTIDPNHFGSLLELKQTINDKNLCGKINDKNLQALSRYLWDIKRFGELKNNDKIMQVPQKAKCPVCGMFVFKYPKWAAKLVAGDHIHFFDGVKDMMKFYFNPSKFAHSHTPKDFEDIKVTDYYSQNEIDGRTAYYVLHSNVFGPMGHELIPFESKDNAQTFLKEHNGRLIVSFEEITEQQVYDLDK